MARIGYFNFNTTLALACLIQIDRKEKFHDNVKELASIFS